MAWHLDPAMLTGGAMRYDAASENFEILIPADANIAADTVGRHAVGPGAANPAIIFEQSDGSLQTFSFADLDTLAAGLATSFADIGVRRGDVVAVHSLQRPETVIAHMAIYKLGAIAATISQLAGPDTVHHILADSDASTIITHSSAWAPFRQVRQELGPLQRVVCSGDAEAGELPFDEMSRRDAAGFVPAATRAEDPALLIYTSGSTGRPKGILHAHRILHALNATIELFYNLELREPGLVFWTAADWAWIGGLNDVVFPSLRFGHTLMVTEHRFDAEWALEFMARHGVTHGLLTPTALKRIAQVTDARSRYDLKLRTIFTGGEALPGETHRGLTENLGIVCNEGYGTSEVNQMIGNCQRLRPVRPGSMGWAFPGHHVRLVDEEGRDVPDGEVGEIVVSGDDPTLFLGYWKQPELTREVVPGDGWVHTRDLAVCDADGYYWYRGRNDDLIKSAGFRIGPAEVEEALLSHPAVADCGVIGVSDDEGDRGTVVKAYVTLAKGNAASHTLSQELAEHVKARIGAYKQPRLVAFVDELPLTRTGKISRAELRRWHASTRGATAQ